MSFDRFFKDKQQKPTIAAHGDGVTDDAEAIQAHINGTHRLVKKSMVNRVVLQIGSKNQGVDVGACLKGFWIAPGEEVTIHARLKDGELVISTIE